MGVRPPPSDSEDDDETTITFGIAALDARLDDAEVPFPATGDEVVRALGDPDVPYDASGHTVALSRAVEEAHENRFENEQELLNALHPVFESHRERSAGGLVERVRSLLPF